MPELREHAPARLVPGEVDEAPLGLSAEVRRAVCEGLRQLTATMAVLALQAEKHGLLARGPERGIGALLLEHARLLDEERRGLSLRLVQLGTVPLAGLDALAASSLVETEPEGLGTMRTMLQRDLDGQERLVRALRRQATQARDAGDPGTALLLTQGLVRQEEQACQLHRALADDSLVLGVARQRFGLQDVRPGAPP